MNPKLYGRPQKLELKNGFKDELFVTTGAVAHLVKMSGESYTDLCLITGLEFLLC